MQGDYKILIIDSAGSVRVVLTEFQTMHLIDILNESGSWSISGASFQRAEFHIGDSICVYRNGLKIYGGVMTDLTEEYNFASKSWKWKASGKGWNELAKWRYVVPSVRDSNLKFQNRERVFNSNAETIVFELLAENLTAAGASSMNRVIGGYALVKGVVLATASSYSATGVYRFENVYDSVIEMANAAGLAIYPVYEESAGGIKFYVAKGKDVSQKVIFSEAIGNVNAFTRIVTTPEATNIIGSYNSDDLFTSGNEMWKYAAEAQIVPNGSPYLARELFYKPNKEDFQNYFDYSKLLALTQQEAKGISPLAEGFEIQLNLSTGTPYSYGYDYNANSGEFTEDYRIGDTVGVYALGESFTAQVTAMEFDVAYGSETIKPTLGMVKKGTFNGLMKGISNNNKSLLKINNTGVIS